MNTPLLFLHAPWHSSLIYYFEPPKNGAISRVWTVSHEGDKTYFEAEPGKGDTHRGGKWGIMEEKVPFVPGTVSDMK
jgi:hypothetical protein